MSVVRPAGLSVSETKRLLAQRAYHRLKKKLSTTQVADLLSGWLRFSAMEQTILFKLLSIRRAVEIFARLRVKEQMHLLGTLETGALGPVLEDLSADSIRLFHKIPNISVRKMMAMVRD